MDEREFETQLERMFAQPPTFADEAAFTRGVEARLTRNWRLRAVSIAFAGAVGGLIAISQTIGSGLGLRIADAGARSERAVAGTYNSLWEQASVRLGDIGGADLSMNLFWVASALLIMAAGAMTTRMFDET